MSKGRFRHRFPVAAAVLILFSLACNLSNLLSNGESGPEQDLSVIPEVGVEPDVSDAGEGKIEKGSSRQMPIPVGELVSVPGWDLMVLECLRGASALQLVQSDGRQATPPQGTEIALAKVFLRNTSLDEGSHSLGSYDLYITGSNHRGYFDQIDGWPAPEFLFEDMYAAEAVEGWIDVVIPVDETDLMLVLDLQPYSEDRITRYFELEPAASISPAGESFNQVPNDVGLNAEQPASIGAKMIMAGWDITVLTSVRGSDALALLAQEDADYKGPDEGEEYILLNVLIHYFGDEIPQSLSDHNFKAQVDRNTFYGNIRYPRPTPLPWINGIILPGAVVEGWAIVAVPEGLSNPLISFDTYDYDLENVTDRVRFFTVP